MSKGAAEEGKVVSQLRFPMRRPGRGKEGTRIELIANHFRARLKSEDVSIYQYNVVIQSQAGETIEGPRIRREVIYNLFKTDYPEIEYAFDGEKALYTVKTFENTKTESYVFLGEPSAKRTTIKSESPDKKKQKSFFSSNVFTVSITRVAKISTRELELAVEGYREQKSLDVLRVIDTTLRQQALKSGCLLVGQSFFNADSLIPVKALDGFTPCNGFHYAFCITNKGLTLNIDVASTTVLTPGPVLEFIQANQRQEDIRKIDWEWAAKMLKHRRVVLDNEKEVFKISSISQNTCDKQFFSFKMKKQDASDEMTQVSVHDYFSSHRRQKNFTLHHSKYLPCLNVGSPSRPKYLPLELCSLVSLQRCRDHTLSSNSRTTSQQRIQSALNASEKYKYFDDRMLRACGISVCTKLIDVEGRILKPPMLKFGHNKSVKPRNGKWSFQNMSLLSPAEIKRWAVVSFSTEWKEWDVRKIYKAIVYAAKKMGMIIDYPDHVLIEEERYEKSAPITRVVKMFAKLKEEISETPQPQFILCLLPKKSDIYGPWKKTNLLTRGTITQCISASKIDDKYATDVVLKINSKLGGINTTLLEEDQLPLLKGIPTMILGMDVYHSGAGSNEPSIAAVVGSTWWPSIAKYQASVRNQSPKAEMIESLFEPLEEWKDDGIIHELMEEFHVNTGRMPAQIIIFRDGVPDSQFKQVLNFELEQVIKAFGHIRKPQTPKITLIVAQKGHHTRFFQKECHSNVPPGTVVDSCIVHPRNYDFYMCAQSGTLGTSRPTHYHVLLDQIGFSVDQLQSLIHSLSYVFQRGTRAISEVAPIRYAHLAAAHMGRIMKSKDSGVESPSQSVPNLGKPHTTVRNTMFFC